MNRISAAVATLTALLAACGTPQEQCIRTATRELRTVERLLAETEANLRRGYAYEEFEVTTTEWVICDIQPPLPPPNPDGTPGKRPRPRYCLDDVTETVRRPVAIDPAVEQRKRAGLIEKRKELTRRAAAQIEACKVRYPE